jgi:alpha-glucosidase
MPKEIPLMRATLPATTGLLLTCLTIGITAVTSGAQAPAVTPPPESFFALVQEEDRDAARAFYAKYIEVDGMPVAAAAAVADRALERTHEIVSGMLAGRPDIARALVDDGMYLIIIGRDQKYTDMPEYRNRPNPDYLNERVRGTGGRPTSFGEENLLSLPLDRYDDESIAVHEFCHTIDGVLGRVDPEWRDRNRRTYRNAMDKGLYHKAYAAGNAGEYWAEIAQAYFDCNRVNNWNHIHVGNREQLKRYDPEGYALVHATFNLPADRDWRYGWLQPLPTVTAPPAPFGVDPYYTKFTWAREFTVLGRDASEEALLRANDTIRKMFAYRHDVLKALIVDGVRLVVLGPHESIADLPEYRNADPDIRIDTHSRTLAYSPSRKLLAVGEENVLGDPGDPAVGEAHLVRLFADALYQVTAMRPVDPNWEHRGRDVQQYELHVQRLDVRFDEALRAAYTNAREAGRWQGTAAVHDHVAYWTTGGLAYFDAIGQAAAPTDAIHPVTTREALAAYDPALHALVHTTMAYEGHVDWRYAPHSPEPDRVLTSE